MQENHQILLAMISLYRPPVPTLLTDSSGALWTCKYNDEDALKIIDVRTILSVVAMQPLPMFLGEFPDQLWFAVEKYGIDDIELTGYHDVVE